MGGIGNLAFFSFFFLFSCKKINLPDVQISQNYTSNLHVFLNLID